MTMNTLEFLDTLMRILYFSQVWNLGFKFIFVLQGQGLFGGRDINKSL